MIASSLELEGIGPDQVTRGHYTIYLGMAAGVGKTYRMLQDGRAEAQAGRDVVVGYLEPHDRAETVEQAEGLEILPRRRVTHRSAELEDMDLPGVLRRDPELCLIDELAHTNAPGLEHEKRFQDIEDVLRAGIDVFSTVNVQHLESLNDRVSELTGIRVRETVPDDVLGTADEIVLIDVTPEALIERLRAGKVYPPARVEAALNNFFKIENLGALREVALRQVAEEVESKRLVRDVDVVGTREEKLTTSAVPQAVAERLLALVKPQPRAQRVVRRAWRSAQRLQAELDVVWIQPPESTPSPEEREQLDALRRLTSVLGAHLLVETGTDLTEAVARVAKSRGTTYILMGTPSERRGLKRFSEALPVRLVRSLPGVDVRIVADRSSRDGGDRP